MDKAGKVIQFKTAAATVRRRRAAMASESETANRTTTNALVLTRAMVAQAILALGGILDNLPEAPKKGR